MTDNQNLYHLPKLTQCYRENLKTLEETILARQGMKVTLKRVHQQQEEFLQARSEYNTRHAELKLQEQ